MNNIQKKMTEKQQKIFEYIKDRINESGFPPTVREIGDEFNITVKGAYDHIKAIEKKGYIRTEQNKSRAIVIVDQEPPETDFVSIPLVGHIAAGMPILAEENIDEYLTFPRSMFSKSCVYYALRVRGDSMEEGGILDGDIAIIRKQDTADNGDIVASLLEDEATLKIFRRTDSEIQLIPQNSRYKPIICQEVKILGKLAAVFRRY